MKKIAIILIFTSCSVNKNINKSIKNLETLQEWIKQDYNWNDIPHGNANNYYMILETVINDLEKVKKQKNDK